MGKKKNKKKQKKQNKNIKKDSKNYMIMVTSIIVIILIILILINSNNTPVSQTTNLSHTQGDINATVEIIEYSDFQCTYCARFFRETYPDLKREYIDTGFVKMTFKHLPITSIHPFAQKAAEASECANEQGKFWEMHDKIFKKHNNLSNTNFFLMSKEIGLNENQFKTCFNSGKYTQSIKNGIIEANKKGISSTPTFIVNGTRINGAKPFAEFKQIIDLELSKNGINQ